MTMCYCASKKQAWIKLMIGDCSDYLINEYFGFINYILLVLYV